MAGYVDKLADLGVRVPEVYLPAAGTDYATWAVVACDQYSSEREYWKRMEAAVAGAPSALGLIFPEAYLEDADAEARIARIQANMREYIAHDVLAPAGEGLVLVERFTPFERKPRVGLVLAVDLEAYRYGADSTSLIRPSEGTIVERLPPRMRIRRGAVLELPHIMLLLDDPRRSVIEPIYAAREGLPKLYDFDLMLGSGHARGWKVADPAILGALANALAVLADPAAFRARYGFAEQSSLNPLLFAVGDGNHSLATAKAVWEEIKTAHSGEAGIMEHPARYALVELVNVYDEGLPFHPIHRILVGVEEGELVGALEGRQEFEIDRHSSPEAAIAVVDAHDTSDAAQRVACVSSAGSLIITFPRPKAKLAAGTLQDFLDPFLKSRPGLGIDYIHGTESLLALAAKPGNLGLYLPSIDKSGFFATVIRDGVMPRKTFSMGEAPEKRFYIEARRITR
ncbi:MAG: DUF1015 domain-containing protein [Rectinemataceae bacterium]|jgi:hypothetical protein